MIATRIDGTTETLVSSSTSGDDSTVIEFGDLLVALDTCRRDQYLLVGNTVKELHEMSVKKGEDSVESVKLALLTAFKRRNHNKSQAEGEGAGEILIFLHTIIAAIEIGGELLDVVESILPLVPVYGSWKDLRLIGEMIVEQQIKDIDNKSESKSDSSSPTESVSVSLSAVKLSSTPSVPLHRVCKVICKLFADQLVADRNNTEIVTPSNACKYVPHYTRHFNKKSSSTKRKADGEVSESEAEEADDATERTTRDARGGGRGGRGRSDGRGGGRGRGRGVATAAWAETATVTEPPIVAGDGEEKTRSVANMANCILADEICRLACPVEFAQKRGKAAFRKLRAGLNRQLVQKGHLIEPLMCSKQLEKINFNKACKGALTMYTAAIKKSGEAARWMAAMKRNSSAVPDIDSLGRAVSEYLVEELQEGGDDFKMFDMRVAKALKSIQTSRDKLVAKATELQTAKLLTSETAAEDSHSTVTVPVVGVAVDTALCLDREARMSLVLAAYLLTKAQGLNHLVVDGVVHPLSVTSAAVAMEEGDEAAVEETTTEVAWHTLVPMQSAETLNSVARFQTGTSALLTTLAENPVALSGGCDVVFMCYDFAAYDENKEEVHAHVAALQTASETPSVTLRTIRVHRMRASLFGGDDDFEGGVQYEPRRGLRLLPSDVSQITADLAFVVDFTGSMGSYMAAVKSELVKVISEIQNSVRCKGIRVALVGYRDYNDEGRVVKVEFHERENLQQLLDTIQNQQASGGGDAPEDLLSGLVAVDTLAWSSDIRLQVIITDANAHGYNSYVEGDYHPSGKCPDQAADADYPSLPQIMTRLADVRQVDTFFCQLAADTMKTQTAIGDAYTDDRRGFGTVSIQRGAENFKDKIVACISAAIATTISETKVSGLQTADGITLSSITTSLNASLRESLLELGVAGKEEEEEEVVVVEVTTRSEVEVEDASVSLFDDATEATESIDASTTAADVEPKAVSKKTKKTAAQTDYERLLRELELSELYPVRIAMHMPVWSNSTLTHKSAAALFGAGVTASQLVAGKYPEGIVNSFTEYLEGALARV